MQKITDFGLQQISYSKDLSTGLATSGADKSAEEEEGCGQSNQNKGAYFVTSDLYEQT